MEQGAQAALALLRANPFAVGVLGLAGVLAALPAPKAQRKQYTSFSSFYPFYLSQHALPRTKLLHAAGTLSLLVAAYRAPLLLLALGEGALLGFAASRHARAIESGLPEMALMFGGYVGCGLAFTGSAGAVLALPACAYGFAWVSHFFVEKNRPATFVYPSYSLLGDFVMFAEILIGRHKIW